MSYTSITDTASMSAFNQATFYSYDIHGNVDTLLQDYGPLTGIRNIMNIQIFNSNRWKRLVYKYDLISGKVNYVAYQPPRGATYYPDMFYHRYEYDAENRLILAETSKDSVYWEKDARYEYYKHGPLARTILGEQLVQGIDNAYTLQGWLKGVNSISFHNASTDMGEDGKINGLNQFIARDAYGFNLNYHASDYQPINNTVSPFPNASAFLPNNEHRPLFNGNINSMAVNLNFPNPTSVQVAQLYNYKYDQLNRITSMDVFRGFNEASNTWSSMSSTTDYRERISYDANGNILKYLRNGISNISSNMDSLTYFYYSGTNRLKYVRDNVADNVYTNSSHGVEDINNQTNTSNYTYSEIGNLEKDLKDSIRLIKWNVYGKIVEIQRTASSTRPITNIKYTYDAAGNRISKRVVNNQNNIAEYTWYVRDAQGNVMATYFGSGQASTTLFSSNYNLTVTDQHIYGSSRVGVFNRNFDVKTAYVRPAIITFERGLKMHELSNHLGNVLVTISDKKIGHNSGNGTIDYYNAEVITANDYYPGGMVMPGRKYQQGTSSYRYSINGQEKESELNDNITTAMFWEYDSRTGRRWNVDPITKYFESPYATFGCNPILMVDPLGLDPEDPKPKVTTLSPFIVIAKITKHQQKKRDAIRKRMKDEHITWGEARGDLDFNGKPYKYSPIKPIINHISDNSMEKDIRRISNNMKINILKGAALAEGSAVILLTGCELWEPAIELVTVGSIRAYININLALNSASRKALTVLLDLAIAKYGKDAIYKKELWALSYEINNYKELFSAKTIVTIVKQLDKILQSHRFF